MIKTLEIKIDALLKLLIPSQRDNPICYLIASVMVLVAILARLAIAPINAGFPFLTFFPAVTLSALLCGVGPSLFAMIISSIVVSYMFIPPLNTLSLAFNYEVFWSNLVFFFEEMTTIIVIRLMFHQYGNYVNAAELVERLKVAQQSLRIAATAFETQEAMFITDPDTVILQVNKSFLKIVGYTAEEVVGHKASLLKSGHHDDAFYASMWESINNTGTWQGEIWDRRKNGEIYPSWAIITAVKDAAGAVTHYVATHIDITEHKLMEDELKASEAKFRSIIEVCPVPLVLYDEQLNITFLNPAFVQTFGYTINDIPTLADWRPKAYPDLNYRYWVEATWQATLEKAKQEQTDFPPMELAIRCKNNSIKTVLASAAAINHDLAGVQLVMLYDITQRKQIEDKLNAIFNASVEGIITVDMSGSIVSANTAVETIFGYKPEDLVGCSINKLIPSSPKAIEYCNLLTAQSVSQIQEVEGIHKNGSMVPLDLSVAEFSIDNTHYFAKIVRDVSLRKQREQQDKEHLDELAHVTRLGLMGEMASGIAHEVNQPLAAIANYTQASLSLINTENPDLVKLTEILYKTQQQALRAGQIIRRMREFLKSHTKQRSTADINALIHEAVDLCIPELKQNNIRLTLELENNLPPIYVDHVQIEQVLINLVRNSVDALQNISVTQQRQITIHSHLTLNNSIQVRVKDNGPGLDEGQQQKILMPFYTTKADGMGMGLSISRSLIEAHEGTLHFNSLPGKGITFYFTLPIQKESEVC